MSFTCYHCGKTSYNPTDAKERYCGACSHFCDDVDFYEGLHKNQIRDSYFTCPRCGVKADKIIRKIDEPTVWLPCGHQDLIASLRDNQYHHIKYPE